MLIKGHLHKKKTHWISTLFASQFSIKLNLKMQTWKVYRWTDRQKTDDRQHVIRKAQLSFEESPSPKYDVWYWPSSSGQKNTSLHLHVYDFTAIISPMRRGCLSFKEIRIHFTQLALLYQRRSWLYEKLTNNRYLEKHKN